MRQLEFLKRVIGLLMSFFLGGLTTWATLEGWVLNAWTADWRGVVVSALLALLTGIMAGTWIVERTGEVVRNKAIAESSKAELESARSEMLVMLADRNSAIADKDAEIGRLTTQLAAAERVTREETIAMMCDALVRAGVLTRKGVAEMTWADLGRGAQS